jgi:saccharopine dehydrogenase-like NADP-dependent oxidoreductase|tara:strand:- start:39369 stop:40454 length:1086 start_codon:yes stop_codon:yes gene_type:complete
MNKIIIFGGGSIGNAVYHLLKDRTAYSITVADIRGSVEGIPAEDYAQIDTRHPGRNNSTLGELIRDKTLVINALPYTENLVIYSACLKENIPYFDFSEDSELNDFIHNIDLEKPLPFTMPHCGLAPGMSTVIANNLTHDYTEVNDVKIRVGALSQNATNKLKYHLTWSADGLINEYCGTCKVIRNGSADEVQTLTDYETLLIDGTEYEAFNTSGGLGSFVDTVINDPRYSKADVNYKTIRRLGHHDYIDFLMNDLKIPKNDLIKMIKHGVSRTTRDCVIIFITASGQVDGTHKERMYKKIFYPEKLNDRWFTAIELTTASGLLTMVELFLQNKLRNYGYHKQEDVKLSEAVSTKFGSLYTM